MSRSWPRVMSPMSGRSTLMTSAPNQARSWVQVGPDWTWVKSRMRTPSSALLIFVSELCRFVSRRSAHHIVLRRAPDKGLFLAKHALRIEVADAAALAARSRVDHRVDEGWLARVHGRVDGTLQLVGRRRLDADAAECFHHLVVARAFDEDGRRNRRT